MYTNTEKPLLHWNYFLALESDFEKLSRYVEISEDNYSTYSLEMAHLLLATASEVDVVLKGICKQLEPDRRPRSIGKYKEIILGNSKTQQILSRKVLMSRYNLEITPWETWREDVSPNWWKAYNKIKHQRDSFYYQANLQFTVAALTGLFLAVLHLYDQEARHGLLSPNPRLVFPDESYVGGADPVYGTWSYYL